jgi:hypothetical protein
MTSTEIAAVCHEANRMYCLSLGDYSQPPWIEAAPWQRSSAIAGVEAILAGKVVSPEQSHENWLEEKRAAGWTYGKTKDPANREHPCFVPYSELPDEQRRKDALFFAIVQALR